MTKPFDHDDIMPFGKYKLEKLRDVPASYLLWWYGERPSTYPELVAYIEKHLDNLEKSAEDEPEWRHLQWDEYD